ncbi:hypothetical protein HPB50_001916 [Hyalomma asiaticum]|uniref:Uncharacterized protein n=1 Tax=Hyalomma asiaticum TaxID=266040 RepID=A0ACB7TB94_HYAAI|nr:hypothetical protein HPB50_001916 [Hyalomma asiaticum]
MSRRPSHHYRRNIEGLRCLPFDSTKIVYRPQVGLALDKWNTIALIHAIGRASGPPQQDFNVKNLWLEYENRQHTPFFTLECWINQARQSLFNEPHVPYYIFQSV